jgi:hypothetical protein
VTAIAADGHGGWFIGGRFSAVEGLPRRNLAHVLADGSVAAWNPGVAGVTQWVHTPDRYPIDPGVDALALAGNTLYVGGLFTTVGGQPRSNLASVDATTGALQSWIMDANGEVRALMVRSVLVYAGGWFDQICGQPRGGLAAIDARTKSVTPWDPNADGRVDAIEISGGTAYVGGEFDHVGGLARNSLAAVDLNSGRVTPWDAKLTPNRLYTGEGNWTWPYVRAIAAKGKTIYVGGWFGAAGGVSRAFVAGLDVYSAAPTEFDARLEFESNYPTDIEALAVRGHTLYAGGRFEYIGGRQRPHLAALDATSGDATSWNPRADDAVEALAVDGDQVFAGGSFTSLFDWVPRQGAAAIDLASGRATGWNPLIDGDITGLAIIGSTVYLAGDFADVDGVARYNIAAVDARSGALLPWYPGPLGSAGVPVSVVPSTMRLAAQDGLVYVGGVFYGIGGKDRNYIAQLDGATAEATSWNAYPDGAGTALLPTPGALYVAGGFVYIGGIERSYLAAVDPVTAATLPWDPRPSGGPYGPEVFALAKSDTTIYAGGLFARMRGEPRHALAAMNATTGVLSPWAPEPDDLVEALGVHGNEVWVGGTFQTIGGLARANLAALDATTGRPSSWDARADGEVLAILTSEDSVFVGGAFHSLGGFPQSAVAMVVPEGPRRPAASLASATQLRSGLTRIAPCAPNPVNGHTSIRYSLAAAGPVGLAVFDLQGRRIANLVDGEIQSAGEHQVDLHTSAWRPGIYLCRLDACGTTATVKMLVAR